MSNRRTLMAAAAIVLALVAGIGVYMYASGADERAQENASLVDAYVANADIAKGTTGPELVQANLITKEKVAKGSVPPGAVTDLDSLADLMTAGPISTKQFITLGSFVSAKDGGGSNFSQSIASQNLVAVTVSVGNDSGVAHQIAPGDHVNIAAKSPNGDDGYQYVLDHVKVLAVGASTTAQQQQQQPSDDETAADASAPAPSDSGLLTFEVTQDQALQIINANQGGGIYLVLLAPDETAPTSSPATASTRAK